MSSLQDRLLLMQKRASPSSIGSTSLSDWTESTRAIPNIALRSALFAVLARGKCSELQECELSAPQGISINYTGPQLNQLDLELWSAVLSLARQHGERLEVSCSIYRLLQLTGVSDSGKNRTALRKRLLRLQATALSISIGALCYVGSLLDEQQIDKDTAQLILRLNPRLAGLFNTDQYTRLNWNVRSRLSGKPLAQWLHGFYSSHRTPYPYRIDTIWRLCGSNARVLREFKKGLLQSLADVSAASEAEGLSFKFFIDGQLVHVSKRAT